jgi:hypothetical protein
MDDDDDEDLLDGLASTVGNRDLLPSASSLSCSCFDPNCRIKRYFRLRTRRQLREEAAQRQKENGDPSDCKAFAGLHLSSDGDGGAILAAQQRLLREAGGAETVTNVYQCCLGLYKRDPQVLSAEASEAGDTVLTLLCSRTFEAGSEGERLLLGQIMAFVRLYLEVNPEMLFARNRQGSNALILSALSNKASVAAYLALIYADRGRDANEADDDGHTVLHVMARKGDDCAETLEEMLRLRDPSSKKKSLFRLDVVNAGGKTPLDVAVACQVLFATGSGRIIYDRIITAFHDVIEDEAREMGVKMEEEEEDDKKTIRKEDDSDIVEVPMTFRNF